MELRRTAARWNYAELQRGGQAAYIEVITDPYEAPALPNKLRESIKTLYNLD